MHVVERGKRARQILLDEVQRAAERLEAHLDEDAGRILDVVAGRLHETSGLPQLREHPARTLGQRRVREHDLRRQAQAQRVRVELRASFPRAGVLELEHPRLDVRGNHRLLGLLDRRQIAEVDVLQAARKPGERPGVLVDALPAVVLDMVVVRVNAIERRARRMDFVKIGEIVINEMMKWFGRTHHLGSSSNPVSIAKFRQPTMVQYSGPAKRDYSRTRAGATNRWPADCTSFRLQLGTSTTSQCAPSRRLKAVGLVAAEDTRRTDLF